MAGILSIGRIPLTRGSEFTDNFQRDYEQEFFIVTDQVLKDQLFVMNEARKYGLPFPGDSYKNEASLDQYATVVSVRLREHVNPQIWIANVKWSTNNIIRENLLENPLLRPPIETWDCEDKQFYSNEIVYLQIDPETNERTTVTNIARNTAGETLTTPPPTEETILVLTRVENVTKFDPVKDLKEWRNQVNSEKWRDFNEGTCRITKRAISSQERTKTGLTYYKLTTVVKISDRGWKLRFWNAGFNEKVGGVLRPITGNTGRVLQNESGLNLDGTAQGLDEDPIFRSLQRYGTRKFSDIL